MKSSLPRFKNVFLRALASVFNTARWFGIPWQGGMIAICTALIILLMLSVLETAAIWKLVRAFGGWAVVKGSVTARLSGAIFYGNALFSQVLSWKFMLSWQDLSFYWTKVEMTDRIPEDGTIQKKMAIVTSLVAICATFEHVLSMMAATGIDCPPAEYFERYILNSHGFLLHSCEYSLWVAIPIFILSKLATVYWNFQDLIIILVSMGLTSRYHRLNFRLSNVIKSEIRTQHHGLEKFREKRYLQTQTWRSLREAYVRQAELVRRVDGKLGALILLSNFNNLYFICLQLFLGINSEQGQTLNRIYYVLSLSWLIVRACSVVLAAADINHHSRNALPLLQTYFHGAYNIEASRLKTQLKSDFVAMKAMGLFVLDRGLLLRVAAAILKYELVLIQFDKHDIN